MPDLNAALRVYLVVTIGLPVGDLTSNLRKQTNTLTTGDLNQKIKAIILSAGASN